MARLYVETSALLRGLLEGDADLLGRFRDAEHRVTSAFTFVEAARAVGRARREGRLAPQAAREAERWLAAFERSCDVVALDERIVRGAKADMAIEPVRTLDALHLATILMLEEELGAIEVASCDDRVRRNVEALGFRVVP
ncbi:MAG: PIN domain-containing protein [Anaeromyxobacteraceae bacterium]